MKLAIGKVGSLAIALGFGLASTTFGQTVVNFGITAAGPTGNNLAGVYTDPYVGCVGCTAGPPSTPGTTVQIFCDDFTDDVSPPEYWLANSTSLSQFTGANNVQTVYYSSAPDSPATTPTSYAGLPTTLGVSGWSSTASYSQTSDYIAAAILASESISAGSSNETAQNDLSFALWGIFDSTLLDNVANASEYGTMDAIDLKNAQIDLETALVKATTYASGAAYTAATGVNATIYTACTGCTLGSSDGTVSNSSGRPQEFLVVTMPEPSTIATLGAYSLGLGLIGLIFRRRHSRSKS